MPQQLSDLSEILPDSVESGVVVLLRLSDFVIAVHVSSSSLE